MLVVERVDDDLVSSLSIFVPIVLLVGIMGVVQFGGAKEVLEIALSLFECTVLAVLVLARSS